MKPSITVLEKEQIISGVTEKSIAWYQPPLEELIINRLAKYGIT
jgi:hypothetical protein